MTQLFATPPKLGKRQEYVHALTGVRGTLTALEAGVALHRRKECVHCRADRPCDYAVGEGRDVLESLRRKGLVKRDRHWTYRLADPPNHSQTDEIPY